MDMAGRHHHFLNLHCTQTTRAHIRRLPKGMRWTPRKRRNEGESGNVHVHVCGELSESEE